MTIELITGHAGSAHISAADDGWLNVGIVGEGKYVLDTGTQFACNVQSANLVTIGIGDALFEGRHVRVSATENVAIDNGAQGVNRNDIICIKYEYDSGTSVETASLAVIKGTASSSTPTDPTIPSGSILEGATAAYMPLWRIPISGITVGTPENMYGDVLVTLDGMLSKTWTASQIPNLAAGKITSGTFDAARIPSLDASKIGSGTLAAARIPSLDASKISTGTFGVDRIPTLTAAKIPNLSASKITSGTFGVDRIPTLTAAKIPDLSASKITSGTIGDARLSSADTTATINTTYASGGSVSVRKRGKMCEVTLNGVTVKSISARSTIATVPSGYRPVGDVYIIPTSIGSYIASEYVVITSAGAVNADVGCSGRTIYGTVTYALP